MMYEPKNFENLIGLEGLSEGLVKNHFTLYQGYVNNTNKLDETLIKMEKEGKFGTAEYAELNRRLGWEFNGMRLHEYYFENLTKDFKEIDKNSKLFRAIEQEFGSFEFFEKDFKSMGAMRGIGWVVLYYDKIAERLFNVWINEHDVGHLAGAAPLLVIDVFEHAYMIDYGLKRTDYIEAFFKIIDWEAAIKRF
ncbi:MAG: superoxide dismutase [Candidatus Portnoybacteria bacterium RIFCSPLOWO2_12_FULL_39_9]|uniref:superoxide dismutase n=1 Tax=Candidatus Portnoybacteria bacterium RIFCSPHIGHO2_12_FULL_38_9 TaxID=1801997 RepID=A0A1G2FFU8_9BACT|nr:MAG: superoxide dismutase [Candidatus Portnoybacteria bacterium RBG_13_40_8]OGZ35422.1 MAG: superoxide dismutase [Candidatus Portnoybacteria bacterium RIFCSPHIGHO2_02_FULL_39_12]OGZ36954.1 MAG: superoxide dismutase [Candidatus Portnoybacteria bacterium RIFCSPHIGHO2_12_FULL_38_9]OGZ37944.1 MAG: superoxide dismutase [Candidatus Portnoybacteria bacterium RIFCSPLOWO2_01_FULL_38_39]OGZ39970.1 MAG: superoxide dismutase [Candidatus Portnoybacteria bacterium RIFCSPLOWO2_12_FULL_39_9]